MQTERLSYPYVPGEFGIPFSDLIDEFKAKSKRFGVIKAGSGAELEFWFGSSALSVMDITHQDRGMTAYVLGGIAIFNLQTRSLPTDTIEGQPDPHPDMFASEFVRFALDYFASRGEAVNACKAQWNNPSLNRDIFEAELQKDGDRVRAARETWTGKLFTVLGFSQIEEGDVTFNNNNAHSKIFAMFHRPLVVEVH